MRRREPGPGLLLALGGLATWALWFYRGQNRGHRVGGPMSLPKIGWLTYALTAWYVVPAFFWRDKRVHPAVRRLYGVHLGAWAARGVAELVLMYGFHAWKPPYGIAFNSSMFALLAGLRWYWGPQLDKATGFHDRNALIHMGMMQATLIPETAFAGLFFQARQGDTETIWFADDSPRYRLINRFTMLVDLTVYPVLGLAIARYYRSQAELVYAASSNGASDAIAASKPADG
ncbi:MAG: hypothetical protein FJZ00_12090 [Candidatus Sericytochromatia bacterium]|uniref:Uncharacterized protein n=1 Tax=Candidatus Tanganyikabacteria bacterium TaxID=2961651 RepID=A0A938BM24_9BACT|nr:hypothetical protein [Candidatus Tanganyikabacteria bacterium]